MLVGGLKNKSENLLYIKYYIFYHYVHYSSVHSLITDKQSVTFNL